VNWEAAGALGEIVSAIAVLVTLLYLATQIRQAKEQTKQSNELSRFSAARDLHGQFNDLNRLIATDSSLRQVLVKPGELSVEEREQVYAYAMMFCNVWMSAQAAYDNGLTDESGYAAAAKDVRVEINRWPHFRAGVDQWLSNYPENSHQPIFQPVVTPHPKHQSEPPKWPTETNAPTGSDRL
jgi:hypothetical protein